jgi:hypothetical protein
LEIECYCNEIDSRIRLINNREVKNGRKSWKKIWEIREKSF